MDYIHSKNEQIEDRIEFFCTLIDSVIRAIKKPKRILIIKTIYKAGKPLTFKEIEELTRLPTTTLRDNLEVLHIRNIITRTDDRPSKYLLTDFAKDLLGIQD
jgi:DNA-binding HxlR family transcriptional regulator